AGRNVLVVQEFIDRHRIPTADVRRIQRMQARESARAYKVLVVDVEPGTRYSIGAELIEEGLTPEAIRENAFWQPVVWESRPEACRRLRQRVTLGSCGAAGPGGTVEHSFRRTRS